jgi:hypothetical protein
MGKYLFICQIYVDDIIFGSTSKSFCDEFSKIMMKMFEMSMMGELIFFFDFKSSKLKMRFSLPKLSILVIFSRSLV